MAIAQLEAMGTLKIAELKFSVEHTQRVAILCLGCVKPEGGKGVMAVLALGTGKLYEFEQ